eukprot:COSAG01_NODE_58893_length_303_cov_0.936275_1_plen_32_part_01
MHSVGSIDKSWRSLIFYRHISLHTLRLPSRDC